jgi:hypothetical protein
VAVSRVHYLVLAPGTTAPGSLADQAAHWATASFPSTRAGNWLIVDLTADGRP